jgi:hypothetical protein
MNQDKEAHGIKRTCRLARAQDYFYHSATM